MITNVDQYIWSEVIGNLGGGVPLITEDGVHVGSIGQYTITKHENENKNVKQKNVRE